MKEEEEKLRAAEEEQTKLNAKLSEAEKSLEVSIGIVIIKCTSICHLSKENCGGWLLWWLRGSVVYYGFSQTPWVRVLQLPVFRFSPSSQQAEFHLAFVSVIHLLTDIYNHL